MKTILTSALAVAALLASGTMATSQVMPRITLYDYIYFSDATYTEQVGYQGGRCYGQNPAYAGVEQFVQGTSTAFLVKQEVGYCTYGGETIYI